MDGRSAPTTNPDDTHGASPASSTPSSRVAGFYKLPLSERRTLLLERFGLSAEDVHALDPDAGLAVATADHMVENAVGVFGLPLGLALNFIVDGDAVVVPMAVEEPSVVAACSHIARLAADGGGFVTSADAPRTVGQVQLLDVPDLDHALAVLAARRADLVDEANRFCAGLVQRGGGVVDVRARVLPRLPSTDVHGDLDDGGPMLVVHVVLHTCDAMGANAVNTVVEGLASTLEKHTGGRARLRILTNLADERCARATMRIPYASLGATVDEGRAVALGIVEAFRFAARDPYRACTHNKGIMNGVDAVAIATANDWRAIEAGAHAYAARTGRYTSLSRFFLDDEGRCLVGSIELPMAIGVVGGATRVHPTVAVCRKLLGPFASSVEKLSGLLAAVGLAQNTAALKALATEGIQRGHMTLHARQVALAAGASDAEVDAVAARLVHDKAVRLQHASDVLAAMRASSSALSSSSSDAAGAR